MNKTEKNCYYGKLEEILDPLNLSMSSTIDPEKVYPVYLNLAYWEKASGKNLKLTKTMTIQPGKPKLCSLKLKLIAKLLYQRKMTNPRNLRILCFMSAILGESHLLLNWYRKLECYKAIQGQ